MEIYGKRRANITTTLAIDLKEQATRKGIKLSYALAYGLRILLGLETAEDRGGELAAKVEKLAGLLAETTQKNEILALKLAKFEQKRAGFAKKTPESYV